MTDLLARRLRPSPQALETRVGEETVILHLGNDTYYGLDPLGTRIWELLRLEASLPAIRDEIAAHYGVESSRIEEDMRRFLADLLVQELVVDA